MTLASPWLLVLAILVPAAFLLRRRRGEPALLITSGRFFRGMPKSLRIRLRFVPKLLTVFGLLLVVVAIARPVESVPLPVAKEGINILLCIDVSSSMSANDMDPKRSRLDVAKEAAARFIEGRRSDRIGLVCFARYPDLRCPLTRDHEALGEFLSAVTLVEYDGPEDRTGIGAAVVRAAGLLPVEEGRSPVVILLTDGEENVATADKPEEIAPVHAGQLCETLRIRVYAIAAGLGHRDSGGRWVAIDTTQVRTLAERTGGRFFEARDADAVAGVYAEIDDLERVEFAEPQFKTEERFLPILAAALALLALARLLEATWLRVLP